MLVVVGAFTAFAVERARRLEDRKVPVKEVPAQALLKMPTSTVFIPRLKDAKSMLNAVFEPLTENLLSNWNTGGDPDTRS